MKFDQQLISWDADLKAGRGRRVAEDLHQLDLTAIPREWLWQIAKIARRTGSIVLGLKILGHVIHPNKRAIHTPPTADELAEHAALLIQLGAVRESMQILENLDAQAIPDVLLYKSYGHFSRWEYTEAIPLLEKYLTSPLDPYAKLVGQLNLAAAYIVAQQIAQANTLLDEISLLARENLYTRILGNCYELRAQMEIRSGRWASANMSLKQARDLLAGDQSLDNFFVRKWSAILEALRRGDSSILVPLREETQERGEWETLREIDLNSLKVRFERESFNYLYFGTPYEAYRERVATELKTRPTEESLVLGSGAACMDLLTGEISNRKIKSPTSLVRQLLQSLMRDLYRPVRLGGLFGEIFPRDHFDVNSSPNRVHQVIHRTRAWLNENSLPLEIREDSGCFRLIVGQGLSVKVPLHVRAMDNYSLRLEKLKARFLDEAFSPREGREFLKMTESTFRKFASAAIESEDLERMGAGSAVFYRLAG